MDDYHIVKLVNAVQYGDMAYVKEAITEKRDRAYGTDGNGCSLLHWACINNRWAKVIAIFSRKEKEKDRIHRDENVSYLSIAVPSMCSDRTLVAVIEISYYSCN